MISILGTGAKSTMLIAKNLVKKCPDVHDVAVFDKDKNLLAFAKAPNINEIEKFQIHIKTRLAFILFMLVYLILTGLSNPVVSLILLIIIGLNTLYGWEKYSIRCKSTFGMNILATTIAYSTVIYYILNANSLQTIMLQSLIPGMSSILSFIILTLIASLLIGYLISLLTIGDIKVLNKTQCLDLNVESILKNKNIDKYVISKNGDFHQVTVAEKNKKNEKKHSFATENVKHIKY